MSNWRKVLNMMIELENPHWWQRGKKKRMMAAIDQLECDEAQLEAHQPSLCYTITDLGDRGVVWNVWDLHPVELQVEGYLVPYGHGIETNLDEAFEMVAAWVEKDRP